MSLKSRLSKQEPKTAAAISLRQRIAPTIEAELPVADEGSEEQASSAHETSPLAKRLPDATALAYGEDEPAVSYKIGQGKHANWFMSTDKGATNQPTDSSILLAREVIELRLEISEAKARTGDYDYRLRLWFYPDGSDVLSELNLNACNVNRSNETYVTTPTRSLVAALGSISEGEQDMELFCQGARFRLIPGDRASFIGIDVADGDRWSPFGGRAVFKTGPVTPFQLVGQLEDIRNRFRDAGCLRSGPAVIGELPGMDTIEVTPIEVTPIEVD